MDMIEEEREAQGISEEEIMEHFKEDFPQAYFVVFERDLHTREMTETEETLTTMIWVAYMVGYIRRFKNGQ